MQLMRPYKILHRNVAPPRDLLIADDRKLNLIIIRL